MYTVVLLLPDIFLEGKGLLFQYRAITIFSNVKKILNVKWIDSYLTGKERHLNQCPLTFPTRLIPNEVLFYKKLTLSHKSL